MSRLLADIDLAINRASGLDAQGELQTQKAIYLARVGRSAPAKQIVQRLRTEYPLAKSPRTAILTILVEGVIDLYENFRGFGFDRILRANVLAIATRDPSLISTTSSWRAHIEFERSNFGEMAAAIQRVHDVAPADSYDARARVARVLSDCCALTGDPESSKRWFRVAHSHAVQLGDQAMLDTLIYNNVAFLVARLRAERFLGLPASGDLKMLETALASSRTYQALIDNKAFAHFVDVCGARLMLLKGDYSGCLGVLSALIGVTPMAENNFSDDLVNTEIAYCYAKLGQINSALQMACVVKDREYPGIDADDRLAAAYMWYEMSQIDSRFGDVEAALARLNEIKEECNRFLKELQVSVAGLVI